MHTHLTNVLYVIYKNILLSLIPSYISDSFIKPKLYIIIIKMLSYFSNKSSKLQKNKKKPFFVCLQIYAILKCYHWFPYYMYC